MRIVIAAIVLAILSLAPTQAEQCGTCHPEARVTFESSIHNAEGVTCSSCHGGDPEALDIGKAHGRDFRSLADRSEIPEHCGGCHSDLQLMRPYNLPIDQLALYVTSQHGKALKKGELAAAVCTDCHGTHDILGPSNPASPSYYTSVPSTCARCHEDETLAARVGLDATVPESFRNGAHGSALLDDLNQAAPNCTSCHGVHGAAPPGVGDVDKVCGACHKEARAAFKDGPHFEGMLSAGLPECASCHGPHQTRICGLECVEKVCLDCHDSDSEQAMLGKKLRTLYAAAIEEVDSAEKLAREAEQIPIDVEHHLGRLEEARTYLTSAVPLFHIVTLEPVEAVTRRARSIGEEVQHELYAEMDRKGQHLGLLLFWFYIIVTLALLAAYRKRLKK